MKVSLKDAVLTGLAPDGGLFMPDHIPAISTDTIDSFRTKNFQQIAEVLAYQWLKDDLTESAINHIVSNSLDFEIPLKQIHDNIYTLELFHGPTLAFKDVGARFMARLMSELIIGDDREVTILVATSGDTGSAVAHGFYNVPGINVVILYPSGKVSPLQEKQLTTLQGNIRSLEIKGTFDDCQRLVKQAFQDADLKEKLRLSSANSINIARLIPQSFYYFHSWAQMPDHFEKTCISVPSGNFGNLTGGLLAWYQGLSVDRFIAATNANDVVPHYLDSGEYVPRASVQTIANAMDVGDPSNFVRMLDIFERKGMSMNELIDGYSLDELGIYETITNVFNKHNYILDPHGAIGYQALIKEDLDPDTCGIFLETAHPAKFIEPVEKAINTEVALPDALADLIDKPKHSTLMDKSFEGFKEWLLS